MADPIIGKDGMIQNINTDALSTGVDSSLDKETVYQQLQAQAGSISSQGSIDEAVAGYTSAIQSQKDAAKANEDRLMSQGERESGYLFDKLQNQRTSMLERGGGTAFGSASLMIIDKEIDKSLKDLDMRKNELILQGNALAAQEISKLQVQQLTFKAQAQQQHFTNLLGLGQYGESVKQRLSQERQVAQRMTMDQLSYNLQVQQQADFRDKTDKELANDAVRISIMRSELGIKQITEARAQKNQSQLDRLDGLAREAGFPSAADQVLIATYASNEMARMGVDKLSGDELKAAQFLIMSNAVARYPGLEEKGIRELVLGQTQSQYIDKFLQEEIAQQEREDAFAARAAGGEYQMRQDAKMAREFGNIYGKGGTGKPTSTRPFF